MWGEQQRKLQGKQDNEREGLRESAREKRLRWEDPRPYLKLRVRLVNSRWFARSPACLERGAANKGEKLKLQTPIMIKPRRAYWTGIAQAKVKSLTQDPTFRLLCLCRLAVRFATLCCAFALVVADLV